MLFLLLLMVLLLLMLLLLRLLLLPLLLHLHFVVCSANGFQMSCAPNLTGVAAAAATVAAAAVAAAGSNHCIEYCWAAPRARGASATAKV